MQQQFISLLRQIFCIFNAVIHSTCGLLLTTHHFYAIVIPVTKKRAGLAKPALE